MDAYWAGARARIARAPSRRRLARRWSRLSLILALSSGIAAHAQVPELIVERSGGSIEVVDQSRLQIVGIRGKLTVRGGRDGEVNFMCRSVADRNEERVLGLWVDGSTLILRPAESESDKPMLFEVTVPPAMAVRVETSDSRVGANNVRAGVTVRGAGIAFDGRAVNGSVELEIQDGSFNVQGADDVEVEGRGLEGAVTQASGQVTLSLTDSTVRLADLKGGLEVDLENTTLNATGVKGEAVANATRGSLRIDQLGRGGEFILSETPLELKSVRGRVEIETDAAVQIDILEGGLLLRSEDGGIRIATVAGEVEVEANEALVELTEVNGPVRVSGDQLTLQMANMKGDVIVATTSSNVGISTAGGAVSVQNDWGDVIVDQATKSLEIISSQGRVEVTGLAGPLQLRADGPEVSVHWVQSSPDENSSIENLSGDVRLIFSSRAGGLLQARAGGRIETALPELEYDPDGGSATGVINRITRPTIQVTAGGALFVEVGEAAKAVGGQKPAQALPQDQ